MDTKHIIEELGRKSLILFGGDSEARERIVSACTREFAQHGYRVYALPEHASSFDRILKAARRLFPIPTDQGWNLASLDGVRDVYLDWLETAGNVLITVAECQRFYKEERLMFMEMMGDFLTALYSAPAGKVRFLITLKPQPNELPDGAQLFGRRAPGDQRSPAKIFSDFFSSIDLTEPKQP